MSPTLTMTAGRADTTTARPETSATAVDRGLRFRDPASKQEFWNRFRIRCGQDGWDDLGRELASPVTVLAGTAITLVEAFAVAGVRCRNR